MTESTEFDVTFHGLCKWKHCLACRIGALAGVCKTHKRHHAFVEHLTESAAHLKEAIDARIALKLDNEAKTHDLHLMHKHVCEMATSIKAIAGKPASGSRKKSA